MPILVESENSLSKDSFQFNGASSDRRKPYGYWTEDTVEKEAWTFLQVEGRLSKKQLIKRRRWDLYNAVKKYPGGIIYLKRKIGIEIEQSNFGNKVASSRHRRVNSQAVDGEIIAQVNEFAKVGQLAFDEDCIARVVALRSFETANSEANRSWAKFLTQIQDYQLYYVIHPEWHSLNTQYLMRPENKKAHSFYNAAVRFIKSLAGEDSLKARLLRGRIFSYKSPGWGYSYTTIEDWKNAYNSHPEWQGTIGAHSKVLGRRAFVTSFHRWLRKVCSQTVHEVVVINRETRSKLIKEVFGEEAYYIPKALKANVDMSKTNQDKQQTNGLLDIQDLSPEQRQDILDHFLIFVKNNPDIRISLIDFAANYLGQGGKVYG